MIKNYKDAIEYTKKHTFSKVDNRLTEIEKFLKEYNNPQDKLKIIHIAGTNGKGSTAHYIERILREAGYKTGLFTSPHIKTIRERIKVDGKSINKDEFKEILKDIELKENKLELKPDQRLNWFEIMLVAGFIYFKSKNCDYLVLETGLGGRLDPTNIIKNPKISIITKISKDHTDLLGKKVEDIAKEKAGIIKRGSKCIISPNQKKRIKRVIKKECKIKNAKYIEVKYPKGIKEIENGYEFKFKNKKYKIKDTPNYQIQNIVTAITAAKILNVDRKWINRGIEKTRIEGRYEIISKTPRIIIDGAHNKDGVDKLLKSVKNKNIVVVLSILKTKDYRGVIKKIPKDAQLIVTNQKDNRRVDSKELLNEAKKKGRRVVEINSPQDAVTYAKRIVKKDGVILIFGSFYFISDIKKLKRDKKI